jgi:hypothetical protein
MRIEHHCGELFLAGQRLDGVLPLARCFSDDLRERRVAEGRQAIPGGSA